MSNAQSKIVDNNFGSLIGRIYRIVSDSTADVYVGSTKESLSRRFGQHKADYKRYQAGRFNYVSSFDILKFEDARIELLSEIYDGENIKKVEQYWMENTTNCINKNRAIPMNATQRCKVCDCSIKLGVSKISGCVINTNIKRHDKSAKHLRNLAKLSAL